MDLSQLLFRDHDNQFRDGQLKKNRRNLGQGQKENNTQATREPNLQRTGRSVHGPSAIVCRSNAVVVRRGLAGAEDSRDRALQQRDASRVETTQAKA